VLWHQSILEERPGYLPSLSRLEHWSSATGRKQSSAIAGEIAKALAGTEPWLTPRRRRAAHRWALARGHRFVRCFQPGGAAFWALREWRRTPRSRRRTAELLAHTGLLERTTAPLGVATLPLRGAIRHARRRSVAARISGPRDECAPDAPRPCSARLPSSASRRRLRGAAEAWEAGGNAERRAGAPARRHHRSVGHLARSVKDAVRGGHARGGRSDQRHPHDVFTRLQALYVAGASAKHGVAAETRLAA